MNAGAGHDEVALTDVEQDMLQGAQGEAVATAMRVIVSIGRAVGAARLIQITGAHIDGGLYHGRVGLDFAERLASSGGRVAVPTTLNVSSLDLLHPELVRLDATRRELARRLMDAYIDLGCQPTWTCAPYHLPDRPAYGEQIAWGESNAIVFANSVLGARTARYGDFTDISAALCGRVPDAGLHRADNRHAEIVFRLEWLNDGAALDEAAYGLIGIVIGEESQSRVPAILGLPRDSTEDQLKALGAAAASSGSVAMFHAVGITPEAPTLDAAVGGRTQVPVVEITRERLRAAWRALDQHAPEGRLSSVSVGTPHFSLRQFDELERLLGGRTVHDAVEMYVSTGRDILARLEPDGRAQRLAQAGVRVVVDTCTYITPILRSAPGGTAMTDSAKWAWYAPANLGVEVVYGSLADCVESAVAGRVVRNLPRMLGE